MARRFPPALLTLLYPDDCRVCARPLLRITRVPVCSECLEGLAPLDARESGGMDSHGLREFDWGRGYGAYEGNLRSLIHLLKYAGMRPLARPLAARIATLLEAAGPVDLIVPAPLHWWRRYRRGFNQAELLAAEVSRLAGIPMAGVLRRRKATQTQTGLTRQERHLNVRGAFQVRRPWMVAGRRVALVDDVVTTGATADACAAALKGAGAARVVVLALGQARQAAAAMAAGA